MISKFFYYSKIIFINLLILYFFLYIFEIGLNYKKDKLFQKTRLNYLNHQKNDNPNQKLYLNVGAYKFIDKNFEILPLSGYNNSKILLCLDEKNKPVYFVSDENGFNNQKINKENDFLLIGDSYIQGMCVNTEENLNSQFLKLSYNTVSLGVGGNGPLLELATFKEYIDNYRYKDIILFITPSNDFKDLSGESKNQVLLNYLHQKNYKQNLKSNKNEELKKKILDNFFGKKTERVFNDFFSVYHFNLKELGNKFENIFKNNKDLNNKFEYLNNKKLDFLFIKILNEFKLITTERNIKLYVVFNSLNPDFLFPTTDSEKKISQLLLKSKLTIIKTHLKENNISYFDFNSYLLKKYDKNEIKKKFKKINGHWDHYTEEGFFELAEQIRLNLIEN